MSTESRVYRSELRARQAAHTRARIVETSADLFATQGYQATTLAGIARAAEVSVETVKAAASKAELLLAAFELAFAGQEGAASLADTDGAAGVLELPDDVFAAAVVAVLADANARAHRLWTVLSGAALSDATVRRALDAMLARRRDDFVRFASELHRRGLTSDERDLADLAAELSFLLSPEGYTQLVTQSGWDDARYRSWLVDGVHSAAAG